MLNDTGREFLEHYGFHFRTIRLILVLAHLALRGSVWSNGIKVIQRD
jgi:hypothetical protein